jgi:hypothetical protein
VPGLQVNRFCASGLSAAPGKLLRRTLREKLVG